MRALSKSKLLAFRQCAERLWLEIHRPDLREESAETEARFATGHRVGDIARQLFNPAGKGVLVELDRENIDAAYAKSTELLQGSQPVFEAGFKAGGASAWRAALQAINKRVVDLLPVAEDHFYHPSQEGSWSIKKVLPELIPDLSYEALQGVQDGGMSMSAYLEATAPLTEAGRKEEIRQQLLAYSIGYLRAVADVAVFLRPAGSR